MKRLFLVLTVLLVSCALTVSAERGAKKAHKQKQGKEVKENTLFGGNYIYIEFVKNADKEHPLVFDALTTQDTLYADFTDIDSFVRSIYKSAAYVPVSDAGYREVYNKVFGNHSNDVSEDSAYDVSEDCAYFINQFNLESKYVELCGSFTLFSGERINYSYFYVSGIFMEMDKDKFWKVAATSNGLTDPTMVNNIIMPVSIIRYKMKETPFDILPDFVRNSR
ncbi:MAG: hypothetical protein Q4D41_04700 [Prevotellaceae bacterium]|nr:hypothetical protein [Prevotellaceae bacterium]